MLEEEVFMKIRFIYKSFCFFIILAIMLISVFAEDLPSETSSQPPTQSQSGNEKINENTNSNKPTPTQNNETPTSEKPANPSPKPKQTTKKVKKASSPENSNESKKPDETSKKPDTPIVKLPDISGEEITEIDITPISSNNYISDKIIKGIISWIMILSGLSLIIWVILKNRKINKSSLKISNNNPNKSKPIYYKGLHRK